MSPAEHGHAARAVELRRGFDRGFAQPKHVVSISSNDFLQIRLGSDSYAIRLSEVAGVVADRKVARLPSRLPAQVGLAGFRGAVLAVWDLAALLGYPPSAASRWLAIVASHPLALVLSGFEGHLRLASDAIALRESGDTPSSTPALRQHVRQVVRVGDRVFPIVDISSVVDAITHQCPGDAVQKER